MTISPRQAAGLIDATPGLLLMVGQLMQQFELTEVTMDPDALDPIAMGKLKVRRNGDLLTVSRLLIEGEK